MKKILCTLFFAFVLFLMPGHAAAEVNTVVSILPQEYFVERIGGDKVKVSTMIPPGGNPHTYEPTPGQLINLSQADIYFTVGSGVEFEDQWMKKISSLNKDMAVINTSKGIRLISINDNDHGHGHDHDDGQDHHHGDKDPHVWLSPKNAVMMAANIRDALIAADAQNADYYKQNADELILDLSELAETIGQQLSHLKGRTFLIFHPAWGYFAQDFGLTQAAAEYCGREPTPRQLADLIKQAKQLQAKVIFASPQFSQKSAQAIASEISGRVVSIDPLAKDYMNNLTKAAQALAESY